MAFRSLSKGSRPGSPRQRQRRTQFGSGIANIVSRLMIRVAIFDRGEGRFDVQNRLDPVTRHIVLRRVLGQLQRLVQQVGALVIAGRVSARIPGLMNQVEGLVQHIGILTENRRGKTEEGAHDGDVQRIDEE